MISIYEKMKGIIRMKKFDVHVCLVSDQALPNFIPVLAEDFRPQEVILLATEPMKKGGNVGRSDEKPLLC